MCLKGGIGRRSFSALIEKTIALIRNIDAPAIAELAFHALGVAHQPPDGVHTFISEINTKDKSQFHD